MQSKSKQNRIFLIDGYAMFYRSHFALIRNPLINSKGMHTSALFGFSNQMIKLLRKENPDTIIAAFDSKEKTFRHEKYPEYKATREKMPDEMIDQLPYLWNLLEYLGVPTMEKPGFEADDIIGTLAKKYAHEGNQVYIVSGDKDFMQLINENIFLYAPSGRQGDIKIYDKIGVIEKWGVPPEKIVDLLGLMGDSSDNVPGVMGVGEKTAVKLLLEYGSLESSLDHASEVKNKRAREGLENCKHEALLSKELVTIDTNMNLENELSALNKVQYDEENLEKLFYELEFNTMMSQIRKANDKKVKINSRKSKNYQTLDTLEEIESYFNSLKKSDWLSYDLETTSVIPMECDIVGLSFSTLPNSGVYIPILYPNCELDKSQQFLKDVIQIIKPKMEDSQFFKTGQNVKFDTLILKRHGIDVKGICFDTLLAAHLLKPESRNLKLDYLSRDYLGYEMLPIEDLIGKGKDQISMAEVELDSISFYAAEDADVALQLTHRLKKELEENNLIKFFNDIEISLLPVLVRMEYNGMHVDSDMLTSMSDKIGARVDSLHKQIISEAGQEFNINSTQQLAVILFDIKQLPQIKKRSTAEDILERLKTFDPLPALILEYRKLAKLKNTYVDALPDLINKNTNRIHSNFSQTITATGRLSSSSPNFQNIPIRREEGKEIRKAFKPEESNYEIFSADYSQIELRIMAHLSKDENLIEAFESSEDVHQRTASKVYNVPISEVNTEMRRTAKIVNYGLLYGAGPFRMSQELGIPQKEAKILIESYFQQYSGVKNYIDSTIIKAEKEQFVETILGRKRPVWNITSSNHIQKQAAKRMAINMPIQGTNAEMIKIAMISIDHEIQKKSYKSKMISQVHDELVFEVHKSEKEVFKKLVIDKMENAIQLSVPIKVDYGFGESWYEAH